MRTAGLMMNDVWAHRVLRERGVETHTYDGLEVDLGVLVESVTLEHRGKNENFRPYLHLHGELRSVTPRTQLPYEISQITYSPSSGERIDAFYEFDDQQLVALTSKGYFNTSFIVPEQVMGIEWELPATADVLVLAPSELDDGADVPIVFTHIRDSGALETGLESSGYDLTQYFADHSTDQRARVEEIVDERGLRARSDAINSLFTEEEIAVDLDANRAATASEAEQQEPDAVSVALREVEAEIAAEQEQYLVQRSRIEGTTENLYHERVAPALRDIEPEAPQHAELTDAPAHDLDLDLPQEEEGEPQSGPSFDERKKQVSRRAADLDFGDDAEPTLGS